MSVRAGFLVLLFSVLVLAAGVSGCRLLSQQVACLRDGDCPRDVGLGYCDRPATDGGVGVCVAEDPDPPPPDDDAGTSFPFLDAGPRDGG